MSSQSTSIPPINLPPPPPGHLNGHYILGEILDHLSFYESTFDRIKFDELYHLLNEVRNHNVDRESTYRSFLRAFERTTTYQNSFKELDPETREMIGKWLGGENAGVLTKEDFKLPLSPAARKHFGHLQKVREMMRTLREVKQNGISGLLHDALSKTEPEKLSTTESGDIARLEDAMKDLPQIWADTESKIHVECYPSQVFHNWGLTVQNTPRWTFIPTTVLGIQNIVKFAAAQNLRVRCAGFRHSWSSTFSADGEILISLLNLEIANEVPSPLAIASDHVEALQDAGNELKTIEMVPGSESLDGKTALCRVGVAVTNEQFRRWAVRNNKWALPVDVILVEVTVGGVNGPICHGAGIGHKTIADYVRAVEYIDANGTPQIISDAKELKAAAGCFGLLGVVTHITFALDKMSYALLKPAKIDVGLAIPPPRGEDIPLALQKTWTKAQIAAAQDDFVSRASNDYYSEWFWFTFQKQAWVNSWSTTSDGEGAVEYPCRGETFLQWLENWFGGVLTSHPFFQAIPGWWQAQLLATAGMVALPPTSFAARGGSSGSGSVQDAVTKTPLPNGLHFRRGIQNMRVRDMEFQIPIPAQADGKPDLRIVQRAWWDVIQLVYSDAETPMRLTMEMRIMNGSEVIMAPQRGNQWTCSIEVLTIPDSVTDGEWSGFCVQVKDLWLRYEDEGLVPRGSVRPHWAKEWESLTFAGERGESLTARQYLKTVAYKDAILEFKDTLTKIGHKQEWELKDLQHRFSNELWDEMIFD
ncbi:hypothetical protein BP5796_09462 [Coleophoma crateriformis]|uniref:FAD-binding PCMH-type domain-containing protein n=1 Tax=Coleophoma crateriformis TaxID=565419 RepID=A0A3D8QY18_9HELO|nr:hypothetical protein BP5796_09462 [Coleophoma crateriformis]